MPCRDDNEYYGLPVEVYRQFENQFKGKLDELTRMLCSLCKRSSTKEIVQDPELAKWWKEHQEADRKREAEEANKKLREKLRKRALAKLLPDERKILGLK